MRFKKSLLATALLSVLALSGCNSDTATAKTTTIKAIDGYLVNAKVSVDADGNAANGCEKPLGLTTIGGKFNLPIKYKDNAICITAIPDQTIDETRGVVKTKYNLTAPAGSPVVTPITQLLVEHMEQQKKEGNKHPSLEKAKKAIQEQFKSAQAKLDKSEKLDLFGDFLTNTKTNTAIIKVATALVDAQQSKINKNTIKIKNLVESAVQSEGDQQPLITQDGEIKQVQKPTINVDALKGIKSQSINLNDPIQPINLNDLFLSGLDLTYTESELPTGLNLSKDNILSGSISKAGTFTIYINAVNNGVSSDAIKVTFTVKTPNAVPTVIKNGQKELQELTNQLNLTQGEPIGDDVTYAISDLFKDVDGDQLKITSTFKSTKTNTSNGITVTEKDGQLVLSGIPAKADEMTLTISANDGVNKQSAIAIIKLNVTAVTPNAAPTLIKAGQTELQNNADSLQLTQGETIDGDVTFPVSHLFSDVDNDTLTVTAKFKATGTNASNGITVTQKDSDLILSGTPIEKGEMTLTLLANDGVNAENAEATITFDIAEGIKPEYNETHVILGQHTDINRLFIDNNGNDILSTTSIDNGVIAYALDKSISGTYDVYGLNVNEAENNKNTISAYKVKVTIKNGIIQGKIDFSNAPVVYDTYVDLGKNTNIDTLFIGMTESDDILAGPISISDGSIEYSNIQDLNKKLNGVYGAYGYNKQDSQQSSFTGYFTEVIIKKGVIQGYIDFSQAESHTVEK